MNPGTGAGFFAMSGCNNNGSDRGQTDAYYSFEIEIGTVKYGEERGIQGCGSGIQAGASLSKPLRSSGCVNMFNPPSGVRGHWSSGRSEYSSTPFPSGSLI